AAIAAALAGAAAVEASDLDPFAIPAIRLNAEANGVAALITPVRADLIGSVPEAELILAADIFYERDLAGAVSDWLGGLHARGKTVLIGDPGRAYLPRERLEQVATYEVPVTRALEDAAVKRSHVWRFRD
ncbi:class I SAM-dependent methyltransferase, partial [Methylobacterium trifolii]